jgi:predicted secreted Zn-dependent protease
MPSHIQSEVEKAFVDLSSEKECRMTQAAICQVPSQVFMRLQNFFSL